MAPKRYCVEVPKSLSADRKRRRHFFSTEAKAEAFLRAFKAQLRDLGSSVRILKPVDSIDANEAIQLLKRHAIKNNLRRPKLRDVADEWIERWQEQHRSVPLGKLFEENLETRSEDSQKHQQSLRYTKERLQRLHARKVSTLTKEEIEDAFWKLPRPVSTPIFAECAVSSPLRQARLPLEDKVLRIRPEISKYKSTSDHRSFRQSDWLAKDLPASREQASHGRLDSGDFRSGTPPALAVNAREASRPTQARSPQCAQALLRLPLPDEARQH
jgi:hypothetical protein